MNFILALLLLYIYLTYTNAQLVTFGLLVCEHGPVIFRQSTILGETFQLEPDNESLCTVGEGSCAPALGFLSGHSGLGLCSFNRYCGNDTQTCLRRTLSRGGFRIEGCCKGGFEGWAMLGGQTTSGDQNPAPLESVRMAAAMTKATGVGN